MRLKIVSDGTRAGTTITNADTGEPLHSCAAVEWSIDSDSLLATCTLKVWDVEVDLVGDATEYHTTPVADVPADTSAEARIVVVPNAGQQR